MQMKQRTSSHAHCRIRNARRHTLTLYRFTFSIYTSVCGVTVVARLCVQSDIRVEAHFLIIHKFSSLSVHECHLNEHGRGRGEGGRKGGGLELDREEEKHH